jgi:transposase
MDAYSLDLRRRIVRACEDESATRPEIADEFSVSLSFVNKLWRRWLETGSAAAKERGKGPLPLLDEAKLSLVRQSVERKPDSTLTELCATLTDTSGLAVSRSTMCRAVQRLGLPLKKSRFTRANATRHG